MKQSKVSTMVLAAAFAAGCATAPKQPERAPVAQPEKPKVAFRPLDRAEGYTASEPVRRSLGTLADVYAGNVSVKKVRLGYELSGEVGIPDREMLERVYKEADVNKDKEITAKEVQALKGRVYKQYAGKKAIPRLAEGNMPAGKEEHLAMKVARLVKANAAEVAGNKYNTNEFAFDGQRLGYMLTFVDQNRNKKVDAADTLSFKVAYAAKFPNGQPMQAFYADTGLDGLILGPASKDVFNTLFWYEVNEKSDGLAQAPSKEQLQRGYDALLMDAAKKLQKK